MTQSCACRSEVSVQLNVTLDPLPGRAVALSLEPGRQRQRSLPKAPRLPADSGTSMLDHPASPHEIQPNEVSSTAAHH